MQSRFSSGLFDSFSPSTSCTFFTSNKLGEMKNSIILKYAWEEDEEFQIDIGDGDRNKSQRVGDILTGEEDQEQDEPNCPAPQASKGIIRDLKSNWDPASCNAYCKHAEGD